MVTFLSNTYVHMVPAKLEYKEYSGWRCEYVSFMATLFSSEQWRQKLLKDHILGEQSFLCVIKMWLDLQDNLKKDKFSYITFFCKILLINCIVCLQVLKNLGHQFLIYHDINSIHFFFSQSCAKNLLHNCPVKTNFNTGKKILLVHLNCLLALLSLVLKW